MLIHAVVVQKLNVQHEVKSVHAKERKIMAWLCTHKSALLRQVIIISENIRQSVAVLSVQNRLLRSTASTLSKFLCGPSFYLPCQ